jgi:glutaredoxin
MDTIILYSTDGCPKCDGIKAGLNKKKINYTIVSGEEAENEVIKMGYNSMPILKVNDRIMKYPEAYNWLRKEV